MKGGGDKALELEDERTAQKKYRNILRERASTPPVFDGPANANWTRSGVPKAPKAGDGELIGRVALVRSDDEVLDGGADFYIGETHAKINDVNVFGWSNPIACTFFRGSDHHYLCEQVAVVRSFHVRDRHIVDFSDEVVRTDAPAKPFRKQGLSVPAPPRPPKVPRPRPAHPDARQSETVEDEIRHSAIAESSTPTQPGPSDQSAELPPVRAEELLRQRLSAPRTRSLAPVLSTLQPDQYDLVTIPAMDSVIIEGQPGTGKTIVASHRAAYLVNDETPPENTLDGTVLVVGPTEGYSRHVRDVIDRLAGPTDRIKVMSLPELINHIIGVTQPARSLYSQTWQDVDWRLVRFARLALRRLKAVNEWTPTPERVYEYVRRNAADIASEGEWSRYLLHLPPYKEAIKDGIHGPLVAFIHWEVSKPRDLVQVEHVIVDEAQDVTSLEWLLLDEINEADAWTILGDLNQRRSDHTLTSWSQVLEVIAIDPDTPIHRMKRGYRSTKPILEFANRLLPRDQRKSYAFQQIGPEPRVLRVSGRDLPGATVDEVERLLGDYEKGTVAVICTSPDQITKVLRTRGWARSTDDAVAWERMSRRVTVSVIDEARGLEFDAVVVVEPSDFQGNLGRQGPLYTALTRANRELVVIHSKSLPERLRKR